MGDVICLKCREPWEIYYLGHDALYEHPGTHAPAYIIEAHEKVVDAGPDASHFKIGGDNLTKTVMSGGGCPACWNDPSRIVKDEDSESDGYLDALKHNLFDSTWDGDPAELF